MEKRYWAVQCDQRLGVCGRDTEADVVPKALALAKSTEPLGEVAVEVPEA